MGRKKSSCTQYFDLSKDELSRCEKAKCRFCGWVSAKNTVRMKLHLAKTCTDCPENIQRTYASQLDDDEESEDADAETSRNEGVSEEVDPNETLDTSRTSQKSRRSAQKSPKRKKHKDVPPRTSNAEENREIDRALADYLFSANLPLATLENPFFVAFCRKLRPSYNLPSRHRVVTQSFVGAASPVAGFSGGSMGYTAVPLGFSEGTLGVVQTQQGGAPQAVPAGTTEVQFPSGIQFVRLVTPGTSATN